jgi:hypothetical protein
MRLANPSSYHACRRLFTPARLVLAGFLVFVVVGSARAQPPTPTPGASAKERHWHKYVNQEYGFSFWYPSTYKAVPLPPLSEYDKQYRSYDKGLLLLQRRDNPEVKIWVRIDVRPFNLKTMGQDHSPTGWDPDWIPEGHLIGRHEFFFYGAGGGGVSYWDQCLVEVKGKTLEIYFDGPYENSKSPNAETQELEPEILKTFRTL